MPSKGTKGKPAAAPAPVGPAAAPLPGRQSALIDTRVIDCGDSLERLARLPDRYVDLVCIDPPLNSDRNDEVFMGETKEKRPFEDPYAAKGLAQRR